MIFEPGVPFSFVRTRGTSPCGHGTTTSSGLTATTPPEERCQVDVHNYRPGATTVVFTGPKARLTFLPEVRSAIAACNPRWPADVVEGYLTGARRAPRGTRIKIPSGLLTPIHCQLDPGAFEPATSDHPGRIAIITEDVDGELIEHWYFETPVSPTAPLLRADQSLTVRNRGVAPGATVKVVKPSWARQEILVRWKP